MLSLFLFQHRSTGRRSQIVVFGLAAMLIGAPGRCESEPREVGRIKPEQLVEISGVAASRRNPDVLWVHNDGGSGQLFAVSTSGKLVAVVTCPGEYQDVEDIAIGQGPKAGIDYLYVGDIGDNSERRREVRVVRLMEPDLSGERGQQLVAEDAEVFRLTYPDGPHNAETLFVDPINGELCIVTKEKKQARLYCAAIEKLDPQSIVKLKTAGGLDLESVSAGAISADGGRVLLRQKSDGWLWPRETGESVAAALSKPSQKVPVLGKQQGGKGEAIDFSPRGDHYFTVSEGKKQAIYRFELPAASD
jgi:hypothetical protein